MAEASIPVDLANPGQVFACMGFLEASHAVFGPAEAGFNCADKTDPRFVLAANCTKNPIEEVLDFLVNAEIKVLAPKGSKDATLLKTDDLPIIITDTYPADKVDALTLPVRFADKNRHLDLTPWCDESSRKPFKLFAGKQRSTVIVKRMREAIKGLWEKERDGLVADPFGKTVPLGGSSFKMDARKSWTPIDVGYSPDEQAHAVEASPVVELLAAIGLEHARPQVLEGYEVRYGVWEPNLPPSLARAALGASNIGVPMRTFRFRLAKAGQNKVVTFAKEEEGL